MIIKSDFHDYYDNCIGYGIDKAVVFERKQQQLEPIRRSKGHSPFDDVALAIQEAATKAIDSCIPLSSRYHEPVVVGFCGKLYVGLVTYELGGVRRSIHDKRSFPLVAKFHWSQEDFTEAERSEQLNGFGYFFERRQSRAKYLGEWYKRMSGKEVVDNQAVFFANGLTSFVVIDGNITINPILKDSGFQRVMDGVTAFQEISMHVASMSSTAIKQPEPITDRQKAQTKGFDDRSFRKSSSEKGI